METKTEGCCVERGRNPSSAATAVISGRLGAPERLRAHASDERQERLAAGRRGVAWRENASNVLVMQSEERWI